MIERPKLPHTQVIADATRLVAAGADREMVLVFLRDRGFDKIDSINTIRGLYGLTMNEAKDLIDESSAWSDRFDSDMKFREMAVRLLRDLAAESAKTDDAMKITFDEPTEPEAE